MGGCWDPNKPRRSMYRAMGGGVESLRVLIMVPSGCIAGVLYKAKRDSYLPQPKRPKTGNSPAVHSPSAGLRFLPIHFGPTSLLLPISGW